MSWPMAGHLIAQVVFFTLVAVDALTNIEILWRGPVMGFAAAVVAITCIWRLVKS